MQKFVQCNIPSRSAFFRAFRRANLHVDADAHGLAEAEVGQGVHGGVERGGEEQRLPLRRAAADQLFDFVLEAELEQAVYFVEHEHVHVVQVHALGEGLGERDEERERERERRDKR